MEILRFTLSGKQAFFKKQEVNAYYYFTYGHIHKVALLGLFGAILGYDGYAAQAAAKPVPAYPEFYARLSGLHTAVMPICEKGSFAQKMVSFNNSVGYASTEQGGNLIVKQQWLENPKWYVYVQVDCAEAEKLADAVLKQQCVYMPYLGTNDHPADLSQAAVLNIHAVDVPDRIDGLFVKDRITVDIEDYEQEQPYRYEEALPCGLDETLNRYQYQRYVLTNLSVVKAEDAVYAVPDVDGGNYHIVFD